ncbi:MAG: beta-lactamase family protein [Planctomycetaceae bacterium]|nr:beta-lactamase family protein [Planctomycetaceae bacterium]
MRYFLFVVCVLCLPAVSAAQSGQTAPENDAINKAMQEFVDADAIAGAVTLVGHRGKIVHLGAVGWADIEKQQPMKKGSLFAIASMTKPIVSTAVMILQDEGKLSVDDKVSKYLPAFAEVKLQNGETPSREMTIRDCVTHTSGLSGKQLFDGSLEEAVDALAQRPVAFSPGERWLYSPGLNVAGRIVEIVSQQSLDEFLKTKVFEPLRMNRATFFLEEKQLRRVATLYKWNAAEKTLVPSKGFLGDYSQLTAPNPSGGLFATARDMFRFYQMVLNGGMLRGQRIVSKGGVEAMISPQSGDLKTGFTPGNCWGLGWCLVREPQGTTGMFSKGTFGHGGAFGTQGWVDPETDTIYVMMIQRDGLLNSDNSKMRRVFQQTAFDQLKKGEFENK